MTPTKTCVLGDACIICGFLFVQFEKTTDGTDIIHKFYQNKLKLNSEKVDCIRKVTEKSDLDLEGSNAGVCRKCFRSVESIIKADEKNKAAKQRLIQSLDQVCKTQFLVIPSPRRKAITKRMLRSPHGPDQPSSRRANPLARGAYV